VDEGSVYGDTIEVNFTEKKYLEGFRSLFKLTNVGDDGNGLTREDYSNDGFSLFCFEILCTPAQKAFIPLQKGQLRVVAKFRTALSVAVTILISAISTKVLEIDAHRNIKVLG